MELWLDEHGAIEQFLDNSILVEQVLLFYRRKLGIRVLVNCGLSVLGGTSVLGGRERGPAGGLIAMGTSYIEDFYSTHKGVVQFLIENGQPTYASEANDNFRRSLILAIASYFEHEISEIVRALPARHAQGNPFLTALVEQKAVSRQYHTYFDWEKLNANKFFALFGGEYKSVCQKKIDSDVDFKMSVHDFLDLGGIRNRLVHKNYVIFDVDKSPEDIIGQFRSAQKFVEFIRHTLLPETERIQA